MFRAFQAPLFFFLVRLQTPRGTLTQRRNTVIAVSWAYAVNYIDCKYTPLVCNNSYGKIHVLADELL